MLQCCVCRRLSVICTECIVAKRCVVEKVTIDSLRSRRLYKKSIGTKMNDLDHCDVVSRSRQPLRYIYIAVWSSLPRCHDGSSWPFRRTSVSSRCPPGAGARPPLPGAGLVDQTL